MRVRNPSDLGAFVREARVIARLSQEDLGVRIGASRFWVAAFERGKPTVELALVLKALHALGFSLQVEGRNSDGDSATQNAERVGVRKMVLPPRRHPRVDLSEILAEATVPRAEQTTSAVTDGAARKRPTSRVSERHKSIKEERKP